MKLLYKFQAEGVWFSKNGTAAYRRGEKPRFLWPDGASLKMTEPHHIAREIGAGRYTRELVQFYRECP